MNIMMLVTHCLIGLTFNFFYHQKFNKGWNKELKGLLSSDYELKQNLINDEYLTINFYKDDKTYQVWIGNKQYSYGHLYQIDGTYTHKKLQYRPSIWTMMKLSNLVDKHFVDIEKKGIEANKKLLGL